MPHGPRFMKLCAEAKTHVKEVTSEEALRRQQQGSMLIDVREADEFQKEHAVAAVHLSKGALEMKIEATAPDAATPLVLYCGGGNRSALAAENLQRMGYTNVASMIGGFKEWKVKGMPTET